jgi:mono/diheme cytochrome c family protein
MKATRSASAHRPVRGATLIALLAFSFAALFGCNYSEMRDDEAVQAYNQEFPLMPKKTIPVEGGIWVEREANPMELVNPLAPNSQMIAWGWERYHFYCVQCHGPKLDGNGTVGQSFAPLPANLESSDVQDQSDGEIFYKIRFGFNRHPALYSTVTDDETWAIVRYVRSMRDLGTGTADPD